MRDAASFAKFVPGFDFLQNLAKGTAQPSAAQASPWVAPTLDPEEIEKRITDLKAVLFWLEQNTTALKATIQAMEVQKMTLATLKGMNMDLSAMTKAFQFPDFSGAAAAWPSATQAPTPTAAPTAAPSPAPSSATAEPKPAEPAATTSPEAPASTEPPATPHAKATLDPLQLWGSLTQQFQQIAAQALQEVTQAKPVAPRAATQKAAKAAPKSAAQPTPASARQRPKPAIKKVAKSPARKRSAVKKTSS